MKLIVACDGRELETFLPAFAELAPLVDAELLFVHVVDSSVAEGWERAAGHHWLRTRPGPRERERFEHTGVQSAQEILNEALALSNTWPAKDRRVVQLIGNPERELVRLALQENADLLAVGQHRFELGPHALGHCARFVIDHAPCPVLLVRDGVLRAAAATLLGDRLQPRRPARH